MNTDLWNKVLAFNFDYPLSEYAFSTRLANKNHWTKNFTEQAILEYKKFMYLAATSDSMVSPSEIVDIVWHQHLIFTESYKYFCRLLGKQIQHIPSTHDKDDFEKFKLAKERTVQLYERDFGQQPKNIWGYNSMLASLNLEKAKYKVINFTLFGILLLLLSTIPAYLLLKPIYIYIESSEFMSGLFILAVCTILWLELDNREALKKIVSQFDKSSFIYDLHPFEVIYSKTEKLSDVVNGVVNELIENGFIKVNSDNSVEFTKKSNVTMTDEQLHITSLLSRIGKTFYPDLLKKLITKPMFVNTTNCIDVFRKYFNDSQQFGLLFQKNFIVLAILLLLSVTRVITGTVRDKPIVEIALLTLVLLIVIVIFLHRLTKQISTTTIPNLYKDELLSSQQIESNWQWSYFLLGASVLTSSFIPLVNYTDKNGNDGYIGGGSDSSSSDGGSGGDGGGSCGGCGGGGD